MVTIKAMAMVIALTICLTANSSDGMYLLPFCFSSLIFNYLLLLFIIIYFLSFFTGYRYCCRRYMTGRLRDLEIKGYSVQTIKEMCPIDAIM